MKYREDQLIEAAKLVQQRTVIQIDNCIKYDDIVLSKEFEIRMADMIRKVRTGEIVQASVRLGWQYFVRRGIAAVLICFMMGCIIMPDRVMAAYQKVMEVIVTVFEDHEEYQLHSDISDDTIFIPAEYLYIPEDLKLIDYTERENSLDLLYMNENADCYFNIYQGQVTEHRTVSHGIDVEDASIKTVKIGAIERKIITKRGSIYFFWIDGQYYFSGQTNLSETELRKIMENIR